ncbi:MAG: phosphatase PAP2 family protein [Gemmatimonadales bacterium]|nr:phosphatase PAP2 family protein [Gemmatimonadales bacterium]
MAVTLKPAERILAGYALVVLTVSLARVPAYPAARWAVAAHAGVLLLLFLFVVRDRTPEFGRLGWLRPVAPILLLLALYGSLDLLSGFGARPTHDALVLRWERQLFDGEPGREWWQAYPSSLWSTVLHAAYLSYYVIVPAPVALFLLRGQSRHRDRAMVAILAAFVACYLCFVFFPVAGPYYEYPRPAAWFVDNWAARAVYGVLSGGSSYGAAFPSSHVAAAWAAAFACWWGSRKAAAVLTVAAALLTVSVVYCQMHYAIDALAGLAVALVATAIAWWSYPNERRNARDN